jgi:hypothetical protein
MLRTQGVLHGATGVWQTIHVQEAIWACFGQHPVKAPSTPAMSWRTQSVLLQVSTLSGV